MGYFLDYLTGGNIKVAASSLAGLHFYNNGDYLQTYTTRLGSIMKVILPKRNKKAFDTIEIVSTNSIKNYVDLVILDLNISAAPDHISYYETYNSFSKEVAGYLVKKNVYYQYIFGDNSHLTRNFVNELNRL